MEDLLYYIEARIKALTEKCESLQKANLKLQHNKVLLAREKELLLQKHKAAIAQIEKMVSRLKSLENHHE